ncbi:MAG TPA: DUF58 domain-containing protein [Chloroflexota bacterium]|nr:DUF58 domain-containing protein [Chloroflexota bacterium]
MTPPEGRWAWPAALGLVILGAGLFSGWPLPQRIGLALLALLAACLLATQASTWALSATSTLARRSITAGETLTVRYAVRNRAPWPIIWTILRPEGIAAQSAETRLVAMPPWGRRSLEIALPCRYRGYWPVGGWRLRTGDPFGFFARSRYGRARDMVLVYPRPLPLEHLALPSPSGRSATPRGRAGAQPSAMVREVRPYQPGDVLSRIHWLSTARRGTLIVREPEGEPTAETWIVVDLDAGAHSEPDGDETVELVIAAAAYLLERQERAGTPTGLLLAGPNTLIAPGRQRGHGQSPREALALAAPASGDVTRDLERLPARARWGTLIAITPWADARWSARLASMARAGGTVVCILVQTPESADGEILDAQALALDRAGVRVRRYRGWAP